MDANVHISHVQLKVADFPVNAVFNAAVVVLLAWAVVPIATKLLRRWLQPKSGTRTHK